MTRRPLEIIEHSGTIDMMLTLEPPWEVDTPRGKADALVLIDYSREDYGYFLVALRGSGELWYYRNDKVFLWWNQTTGAGKKPEQLSPNPVLGE